MIHLKLSILYSSLLYMYLAIYEFKGVHSFVVTPKKHTTNTITNVPKRQFSWKKHMTTSTASSSEDETKKKTRVVIIGGGWAGYSCTEALSTNNINNNNQNENVEIILLDASKNVRGGLAGGYRNSNSNNRPVEAGIHGFWREYRNTFSVMEQIEGISSIDEVLGDFSPSCLYSKNGLVAVAPVLGGGVNEEGTTSTLSSSSSSSSTKKLTSLLDSNVIKRSIADVVPPPLDLPILAEFQSFKADNIRSTIGSKENLQPIDLLSGIGLLGPWADFEQESTPSWNVYDSQPASTLFQKAGVTDALMEELISPLLHVLPMCPAYDCSAAAALSCFHVFALQSKGAFDVRWCKGSISEKIFAPWQEQLENRGVDIRGGARVSSIEKNHGDSETSKGEYKYTIQLDSSSNNDDNDTNEPSIECDAVVLAVGATSIGKITQSSPALSSLPETKKFDKLRGITCVAIRFFLKPSKVITAGLRGGLHSKTQLPADMATAMTDSPVAVCGAGVGDMDELDETGFCIYDLSRMHDEFSVDYQRNDNDIMEEDQVAVLEIDFYRADKIVNMNDDELCKFALGAISAALGTETISFDNVVDSTVIRARNAVSHFAPNSSFYSPNVKLNQDEQIYVCGDWVDRQGHASWSTEKSVVTGRQAASALSTDFGLKNTKCNVIPAAKDTTQLEALRQSARLLRSIAPPKDGIPQSPWIFAKQLLSGGL